MIACCSPHRSRPVEGRAGCGCETPSHPHHHFAGSGSEGGGFGVRRPLRFLAWRLQLSEAQIAGFATILNELKTERAQFDVDERRVLTAYAEAVSGEGFDAAKAGEAAAQRVKSLERLQAQVVSALGRIHALLELEQREKFAYLIRTGAVMM
jgi:Spy/CpxP family protein refolding chaperone